MTLTTFPPRNAAPRAGQNGAARPGRSDALVTPACPFGLRPNNVSTVAEELACLGCPMPRGCVYEIDPIDFPALAALCRKLREELGLSQWDLASRAGVSRGFISTLERGKRGIRRPSYLAVLAAALRVPLAVLLRPARYLDLPPKWPTPIPPTTSGQPVKRARGGLGRRVRVLRESLGLTQLALATRAGLSQAFVSCVEGGTRILPRGRSLVPLAAALETTAVELLVSAGYLKPDPALTAGAGGEGCE